MPSPIARAADVFREHAALSAFENDGARDFDIGALADFSDDEFDALDPVQWPVRGRRRAATRAFFADGGFFTPDRKARLVAPERPAPQASGVRGASRSVSTPGACATNGTP